MNCPLCNNIFTYPISLSCGHSLCLPCTWILFERLNNKQQTILPRCPICNLKILDFYKNFALKETVDNIMKFFDMKDRLDENGKELLDKKLLYFKNNFSPIKIMSSHLDLYEILHH